MDERRERASRIWLSRVIRRSRPLCSCGRLRCMKVFISWSGGTSRAVAEALHWWLPRVIQGVRPFVSAKDIDKGANWTVELARELEDAAFGIICLTPDNLTSPWLHYEAGAITRSVDSRVCPLLYGLKNEQVPPPLSQLQLTSLDRQDVLQMMTAMNTTAGNPLQPDDLRDAVEIWWPQLEEKLTAIAVTPPHGPLPTAEPQAPPSTEEELLRELLTRVRRIERSLPGDLTADSGPLARLSRLEAYRAAAGKAARAAEVAELVGTALAESGATSWEHNVHAHGLDFTIHAPAESSGDVTTRLQNIAANSGVAINVRDAAGTLLEMFPPF